MKQQNDLKKKLSELGITHEQVAKKHGCRTANVTLFLSGRCSSAPLKKTIDAIISTKIKKITKLNKKEI